MIVFSYCSITRIRSTSNFNSKSWRTDQNFSLLLHVRKFDIYMPNIEFGFIPSPGISCSFMRRLNMFVWPKSKGAQFIYLFIPTERSYCSRRSIREISGVGGSVRIFSFFCVYLAGFCSLWVPWLSLHIRYTSLPSRWDSACPNLLLRLF